MIKKIKVHIADDHQIITDGIVSVLENEDNIIPVGYSLNGQEVIDWLKDNHADVLVLDINMPKVDGIEVLKHIKKNKIKTSTLVLSSYDDTKLIKEAVRLGANGFLAKKCAGEHIVEGIKTIFEGNQYFSTEIEKKLLASAVGKKASKDIAQDGIHTSSLTDRELEILKLICKELSSKEIATELYLSQNTVDIHRKNLLYKTKSKNVVGLALYAAKNELI